MIIMGYFIIISQLGDSNEQHKLKFYENRPIMCFDYHKYTHLFWSTDKRGIYHVYMKYMVFCVQNIVIEKNILTKSHKTLT